MKQVIRILVLAIALVAGLMTVSAQTVQVLVIQKVPNLPPAATNYLDDPFRYFNVQFIVTGAGSEGTTAIILLQKYLVVINSKICDHWFSVLRVFHRRSQIYNQKAHRQSAQIIMQANNNLIISKLIKPKIHFRVKRMWIKFNPFFNQTDNLVFL